MRPAGRRAARERGFTFIEMLAASTILLFILFAAYNVIDTNQRIAVHQEEIAQMDASGRSALDLMVTEIRELGFNSTRRDEDPTAPSISVPSNKNRLAIDLRTDLNRDGDTADDNEYVRYEWRGSGSVPVADLVRIELNPDPDREEVLARNVKQTETSSGTRLPIFSYLNVFNQSITNDAANDPNVILVPSRCTAVRVQFTVQSEKKDRISRVHRRIDLQETVVLRNRARFPV